MKKFYLFLFIVVLSISSYAQDNTKPHQNEDNSLTKAQEIIGFRMFPNPVKNGILNIHTFENEHKTIQIFDILGKQVFSKTILREELNVSHLNSGVYILKVSEKGKVATRKLVIE